MSESINSSVSFDFSNSVFLVTGANGGIGSQIVRQLLFSGAQVAACANDSTSQLDDLRTELGQDAIKLKLFRLDLRDASQVASTVMKVISNFGRIDSLINCVGFYFDGDEWNQSEQAWRNTLDTNLLTAMNISKQVAGHFLETQQGSMVHIASRMALLGNYESIAYAASKAGLINVVQAYARLLAPFGRANAISPAAVKAGYWLRAPQSETDKTLAESPMHRFVDSEEIASMALYLCSDLARSITGQNIQIDAGYSVR